jgi:hypothetical protein
MHNSSFRRSNASDLQLFHHSKKQLEQLLLVHLRLTRVIPVHPNQ